MIREKFPYSSFRGEEQWPFWNKPTALCSSWESHVLEDVCFLRASSVLRGGQADDQSPLQPLCITQTENKKAKKFFWRSEPLRFNHKIIGRFPSPTLYHHSNGSKIVLITGLQPSCKTQSPFRRNLGGNLKTAGETETKTLKEIEGFDRAQPKFLPGYHKAWY